MNSQVNYQEMKLLDSHSKRMFLLGALFQSDGAVLIFLPATEDLSSGCATSSALGGSILDFSYFSRYIVACNCSLNLHFTDGICGHAEHL